MSPYLSLDPRSLRDLYAETEAAVREREQQQEALMEAMTDAELSLCFEEHDALAAAHDRLGDELGPLLDRLEQIEEEIAWAERGEDARERPLTL